ncbi:FmdB family transcriptional regulator [Thioalkalivibrio denitrificans]|uniref:FmdB family transcriptional regulator n=1 Tax=Thioalkalivibrio denitrificans TaxID=108003 RepID=A0A1V3NKT7_9GAMM|nr:zinc ribbon domain-containing protein [Thioalkalivibrio denitrificans]OOG25604.1 FmdB family transcriptional regulator [Thioalkalivibrio denitrificans]
MPIYEYECGECSHRLEVIQKISDAPLRDCPECGAAALSKLVSAAGFRLGGGGWYETDFKNGNKRNLKDGGDGKSGGESAKPKDGVKSGESAKPAKTDSPKAVAAG